MCMINQQLQLLYEIEGLLLLVRESVGDIDKADRLNSLIDSKLNKLANYGIIQRPRSAVAMRLTQTQ